MKHFNYNTEKFPFRSIIQDVLQEENLEKIHNKKDYEFYINHYPTKGSPDYWNICGHIHAAWRVQKNTINVCQDSWHYRPVSMKQISIMMNAIENFYDQDVWVADNVINSKHNYRGKAGSYSEKPENK